MTSVAPPAPPPLVHPVDEFRSPRVAYFSMEVGVEPAMPTYSGGLGVLAGDTLRAAADRGLPLVGVTLLYRKGYFRQSIDAAGNQFEQPADWDPASFLRPLPHRAQITIEGREVQVRAWLYELVGVTGHRLPVLFLDSALPENSPGDRALTDHLYGGDPYYRLCQEVILGIGGFQMLRTLGWSDVATFHMNEGHSALLTLALIEAETGVPRLSALDDADREEVRRRCVFTTHTPVPAGHDRFPEDLVRRVLGEDRVSTLAACGAIPGGELNMTHLALVLSHYVNGVAMRHGELSRTMFPDFPISSITNGVHASTWAAPSMSLLFDREVPQWRMDNRYLRYAISIPVDEIWNAHAEAKRALLAEVEARSGVALKPDVLTLGFARRATPYKRADLLLSDLDRLRACARAGRPLQIVYAGKAHPHDEGGKDLIRRIVQAARELGDEIEVVYLEEHDMALGRLLCAGVDLWVNTPRKPLEASGTSGMKAAINGVPSLSVLDGWWIEGHVEGVTGWAIGAPWDRESDDESERDSLYQKLSDVIAPLFYNDRPAFAGVMRSAIAINGSFFNAERMVGQYQRHAYKLPVVAASRAVLLEALPSPLAVD